MKNINATLLGTLLCLMATATAVHAENPVRRMLVEEGTGTWCGNCVTGIVAMQHMYETYPDRFVGIGVHCNDALELGDYSDDIYRRCREELPGAIINRGRDVVVPTKESLEAQMQAMPATTDVELVPSLDIAGQQVTLRTDITFVANKSQAYYRVAMVLVEDSVPATQTNYYAGGERGPMDGFENLPEHARIPLMDVARAIYPNKEGDGNTVPTTVTGGKTYTYTVQRTLPSSVRDASHLRAVAMLIDESEDVVVQCATTPRMPDPLHLETLPTAEASGAVMYYDLLGRRVTMPAPGAVYLRSTGDKVWVR